MDQAIVDDLKQFIQTTISQQMATIAKKDDIAQLSGRMDRLEKKLDNLQEHVSEAIDTGHEAVDTQLKDHEQRLTRLEQATA